MCVCYVCVKERKYCHAQCHLMSLTVACKTLMFPTWPPVKKNALSGWKLCHYVFKAEKGNSTTVQVVPSSCEITVMTKALNI